MKGAIHQSYCVRRAILYGNEVWFLKKMGWELRTEIHGERVICGVCLKEWRNNDLMQMLGLKGAIHLLAMANSVIVYVEEKAWSCLRRGIGVRS